jgi:Tfp pilus assembly protein PilN
MKIKLNLVPPYKKEEIDKTYRSRIALRWEGELFLLILLFIATLVSISYILKINLAAVSNAESMAEKNNKQYEAIAKYDSEIRDVNSLVSDVGKIQDGQLYWSKFMAALDVKIGAGIEVDNLSTKNYTISMAGKADTRDNLLALKNNLDQGSCFTAVDLPLSNLVNEKNIDFQMTFQVKKDCLK